MSGSNLIVSMSVTVDGFISDREGGFEWSAPSDELFGFHLAHALPKVVFSRTLDSVQGNARLAEGSVAEEVVAALDATDKDVSIGGAGLAAQAFELGLVDELRMFRYPVVVGGGTPFLPPVTEDVALDLIETRTFGSRVIYERYRRARDASD
jgi:dihydrofolate reductase